MLTPEVTDPNRAAQLKKQKADPLAFGSDAVGALPKDWKEVPLKSAVKSPAK